MDNSIINITPTQLKNFGCVWKELLKQKVAIVHKVAKYKQVDFQSLIDEFIPEAMEYKEVWNDLYFENTSLSTHPQSKPATSAIEAILDKSTTESTFNEVKNTPVSKPTKKIFKLKKK